MERTGRPIDKRSGFRRRAGAGLCLTNSAIGVTLQPSERGTNMIALLIGSATLAVTLLGWFGHKALLRIETWGRNMSEIDEIFQDSAVEGGGWSSPSDQRTEGGQHLAGADAAPSRLSNPLSKEWPTREHRETRGRAKPGSCKLGGDSRCGSSPSIHPQRSE